jgi:hypothetical protein
VGSSGPLFNKGGNSEPIDELDRMLNSTKPVICLLTKNLFVVNDATHYTGETNCRSIRGRWQVQRIEFTARF